jgi:hypothetical protein
VAFNTTTIWHFDAGEQGPSTPSDNGLNYYTLVCMLHLHTAHAAQIMETGVEPVRCLVPGPISIFNILKME